VVRFRIISDGTPGTTRVLDARGEPVRWGSSGLVKVEIAPIVANGDLITAVFTVLNVGLDIDVDAWPALSC
jgi:hypothetical protein